MNTEHLLTQRTLTVEQTAAVIGIGRAAAYRAVNSGQIPSIRVGRKILIPRQKLADLLGETNENSATAANRDAVQNSVGGDDRHEVSIP